MRKTTSEVEEIQREWGTKLCNHGKGYGHEVDDTTGSDNDYFCLQCGRRHSNPDVFKPKETQE